jgi:hypothetical protein
MSDDTEARPDPIPADPVQYDSPRARIARAKGLETPYIPGGSDPAPDAGRSEERRYGRLLLAMVLGLMFGGFVVGAAISLLMGATPP